MHKLTIKVYISKNSYLTKYFYTQEHCTDMHLLKYPYITIYSLYYSSTLSNRISNSISSFIMTKGVFLNFLLHFSPLLNICLYITTKNLFNVRTLLNSALLIFRNEFFIVPKVLSSLISLFSSKFAFF